MTKESTARYTSRCSKCGSTINPGEAIIYDPAIRNSSRHKSCPEVRQDPKPKIKKGVYLNSPVIAQPQVGRLSDEAAAEILAELGSGFMRPLPSSEPTLAIGDDIEVAGKKLEIGTAGRWVGLATDWGTESGKYGSGDPAKRAHEPTEHVISLIDGTVLESAPWRKTHGIDYWTRQLGAAVKREARGKGSVKVGDVEHTQSGWFLVTSVDKPYYLSAEDAEDFDMFSRGGGWGTPYAMREITEPKAEREKREAQEVSDRKQADALIARLNELRARVSSLLPLGIRPFAGNEHPDARQAIGAKAEVVAENIPVDANPRVLALVKQSIPDFERLPAMPGNENGYLGWTKLYRIGDRLVVMYGDYSYDGAGDVLQGIQVLDEDGPLLVDQANRRTITAYRFDPDLYSIMIELDAEGKLSEYGRRAYFGGTPVATHGPYTKGAYSSVKNQTSREVREDLLKRMQALDDDRARVAFGILEREESVTEIRGEVR